MPFNDQVPLANFEKYISVFSGSSNPGSTRALLPALHFLGTKKIGIVAIGEPESEGPYFCSLEEFSKAGLETVTLDVINEDEVVRWSSEGIVQYVRESSIRPNVIVTGSSQPAISIAHENTIDQALIQAANELNIPCVVVEDNFGFFKDSTFRGVVTTLSRGCRGFVEANVPLYKDAFVTGNPAFDFLAYENGSEMRSTTRKTLGLNDELLLGYAGQLDECDNQTSFSWAVKNLPVNALIYFGQHPRDERDFSNSLMCVGKSLFTNYEGPFQGILPACDALITHASGLALEAVMRRIPVILCGVEGEEGTHPNFNMPFDHPLVKDGAAYAATSELTFQNAVESIVKGSADLRDGQELYVSDGGAAKRVASVIYNTV